MGLLVAATFSRKLNLLGGRGGQEGHPARTPTTRLPSGASGPAECPLAGL